MGYKEPLISSRVYFKTKITGHVQRCEAPILLKKILIRLFYFLVL